MKTIIKEITDKSIQIIIFLIISLISLFNAGFDNNIVFYLIIIGFLGLGLLLYKKKENINISYKSPIFIFLLFTLWGGISFIWSVHYLRTLIEFMQMVLVGLVFILSTCINEEAKDRTISMVILVSSAIGLLGIFEYIFLNPGRIASTFVNPNAFGTFLLILFLFTWGYFLRNKNKAHMSASFLFILAILLTGSRGTYIALILGLPFIFLGNNKKELKSNIIKTLAVIFIALVATRFLMHISPIINENLNVKLNIMNSLIRKETLFGSSSIGRFEFWKAGWRTFKTKPFTGYGLGTYFQSYYIGTIGSEWFSRFAHNHYIQLLAELGIVGLSLFLSFISSTLIVFFKVFKSKSYPDYFIGIIAAFIGFLAHIFIEFSWNFTAVPLTMFWLLGMGVSLYKFDNINIKIKPLFIKGIIGILLIVNIWHILAMNFYYKAMEYEDAKNYDKAIEVYTMTNSFYPINNKGHLFLSNLYLQVYKETKKEDLLNLAKISGEKAIKLGPLEFTSHQNLGEIYRLQNDERALYHIERVTKLTHNSLTPYLKLAEFYKEKNDTLLLKQTYLNATKLIDQSVKNSSIENRLNVVYEASLVYANLYVLYRQEDDIIAMGAYSNHLLDLAAEYDELYEWYNMEIFKSD